MTEAMLVADGEDVPRLSAVVERQRRELARVRADGEAAVVVAMARGVLMERHGWSPAEAARQLAAMAAAAGLPEPEMAAAVLAQEAPPGRSGQQDPAYQGSARRAQHSRAQHSRAPRRRKSPPRTRRGCG